MSPTVSTRTTTAAGITLVVVGLALSAHGALRNHGGHALAGVALTCAALTVVALGLIYRWMTDTRAERFRLARAEERAHEERASFFALKAHNEAEMTRMHRDVVAERARNAVTLAAERAEMYAQVEKDRLQIETKAFQTGVLFERAGMLEPEAPKVTNLIPFPKPAAAVEPQQERSREHGVVGP